MGTIALIRSRRGLHREALKIARDALRISSVSGITLAISSIQTIAIIAARAGLVRLAGYLEGGAEANASALAFYRPLLTATGDLPEIREGLTQRLGRQGFRTIRESSRFAPVHWLIAAALDENTPSDFLPSNSEYVTLTSREEEVARLVARGATNQQIALLLSVSPRTVETHVARTFRKLGVNNRHELMSRFGWIAN
jgi:DNA-binding CsgD family transcriptional regulator